MTEDFNTGGYAVPTRQQVNAVARQAIALGGFVKPGVHRAALVDYGADPAELRKRRTGKIAPHYTCGCGQSGTQVEVPLLALQLRASLAEQANPGSGAPAPAGPLRVCVRCDAAHLMPLFQEGSGE